METTTLSGLEDIQLLIFDLDGTLIDSLRDLSLSVNATRLEVGLERLPCELVATYLGGGVTALMNKVLGRDLDDAAFERAVDFFRKYYSEHLLDHTVTYPGVREALNGLRRRRLAVLTNKDEGLTRRILEGLDLARYFSLVYGGDTLAQKKPDPAGILALMADAGVLPRQTMMVGDSDTDVLTGRNAGVWTCGITYGIGSYSLSQTSPDLTLDSLGELPRLLDRYSRPSFKLRTAHVYRTTK